MQGEAGAIVVLHLLPDHLPHDVTAQVGGEEADAQAPGPARPAAPPAQAQPAQGGFEWRRKARRIDDTIEYFSVERTKDAIARCDIAVLVIDAMNGITEQDKKIADVIVEQRRACIVVVNKWDLVADDVRKALRAAIAKAEPSLSKETIEKITDAMEDKLKEKAKEAGAGKKGADAKTPAKPFPFGDKTKTEEKKPEAAPAAK